jgi:hypothetical protein
LCFALHGFLVKLERKPAKSKLRWRTPLQATGYVRATAIVVLIY